MSNREGSSKNSEGATCPHDEGEDTKRRTWVGGNLICGEPRSTMVEQVAKSGGEKVGSPKGVQRKKPTLALGRMLDVHVDEPKVYAWRTCLRRRLPPAVCVGGARAFTCSQVFFASASATLLLPLLLPQWPFALAYPYLLCDYVHHR